MPVSGVPVRVFISYAHDDPAHDDRVRGFWLFLRANGVDARLDLPAAERRVDWAQWMTRQVRDADRVLVIASPKYKQRGEGDAGPDEGRGAQWEAGLIREIFYADQQAGLQRVLPVVLPGCSADDIPLWLGPKSTTHYLVSDFTVAGAETLLRLLTGQPWETEPPLGTVPFLPQRGAGAPVAMPDRPGLRTEVVIEAAVSGEGKLDSAVWVAGSAVCRRLAPLPGYGARCGCLGWLPGTGWPMRAAAWPRRCLMTPLSGCWPGCCTGCPPATRWRWCSRQTARRCPCRWS